jgi:hypothetical protein
MGSMSESMAGGATRAGSPRPFSRADRCDQVRSGADRSTGVTSSCLHHPHLIAPAGT